MFYIVEEGEARAYILEDGEEVLMSHHGPGQKTFPALHGRKLLCSIYMHIHSYKFYTSEQFVSIQLHTR